MLELTSSLLVSSVVVASAALPPTDRQAAAGDGGAAGNSRGTATRLRNGVALQGDIPSPLLQLSVAKNHANPASLAL